MNILDASTHFDRLLRLIDVEREAEKEENKRELDRWPVETREALGKTVSRLNIDRLDTGAAGLPLLVLSRPPAGEELSPFHAMDQGDIVRVSFSQGYQPMEGTLYNVDEYRVSVALNEPFLERPAGKCQIDLLGSDATYRRMRQALETAKEAGGSKVTKKAAGNIVQIRDVLLGLIPPARTEIPKTSFFNQRLNLYQQQAVDAALAAEDVALVHGPPGTGKTTVLVEIIQQAADQGRRILASAPSNIALDNILEKLLDLRLPVVRLGHPARTLESLRHATLMSMVAEHPDQKYVQELDDQRERLIYERDRMKNLNPHDEREIRREIESLWREARNLEFALGRRIIQNAQIILATHGGIGKNMLRERFDLAVLDEASQATEALSWIPIVQSRKIVLAGDPLQLPPTIYSKEAAKDGLSITLMERLMPALPENMKTLLRVQYRMNKAVMGFSSDKFYEGKLLADPSVEEHLLTGLPGVRPTPLTEGPLVFVDTAGTGFTETWNELLDSRENEGEAKLALQIWQELAQAGLQAKQGAVITPYAAQSKLLRPRAPRGLEVGTVDGFQGREKEAVIVSLVRSNEAGEVGFLGDTRRMNVAITRARRLLVVIGDSVTIRRHPFYADFLDYVEKRGVLRSAWEWISA